MHVVYLFAARWQRSRVSLEGPQAETKRAAIRNPRAVLMTVRTTQRTTGRTKCGTARYVASA